MAYLALYRKYRPRDFNTVYGQETVTKILKNQIRTGRVGHAYLFSGIRGTGKTSIAKIFARAVNCEHNEDGNPCMQCEVCRELEKSGSMDIIEIDAASNRGVDEIRDLREKAQYPPTVGQYKVYIVDEVHMLTKEAFNALLKTLEEPPEHVIFLLATTEPAKLPATILSRCQKFDVRPISSALIVSRMKEICGHENIKMDEDALALIASRAGHSMRDALSLLDQAADLGLPGDAISKQEVADFLGITPEEALLNLTCAIGSGDGAQVLTELAQMRTAGTDDAVLLEQLAGLFREMLLYKITGQARGENTALFTQVADQFGRDSLYGVIDTLIQAHARLRYNRLSEVITETALLKLCAPPVPSSSVHQTQRPGIASSGQHGAVLSGSGSTPSVTASGMAVQAAKPAASVSPSPKTYSPEPTAQAAGQKQEAPARPVSAASAKKPVKQALTPAGRESKNVRKTPAAPVQAGEPVNRAELRQDMLEKCTSAGFAMTVLNNAKLYEQNATLLCVCTGGVEVFAMNGHTRSDIEKAAAACGVPLKVEIVKEADFGGVHETPAVYQTEPAETSPRSTEEQVREIVGDASFTYETVAD